MGGFLPGEIPDDPFARAELARFRITEDLRASFVRHADLLGSPAARGLCVGTIVVAEFVGSDGFPWICTVPGPDEPIWRSMGLLKYALAEKDAQVARGPDATA